MTAFCESMRTLVLQQKEDVDSAVFNTGPYQLSADFLSFEVPQNTWFKMSTKQREHHLYKFREARMTSVPPEQEASNASDPTEPQLTPTANKLSINLVDEGVISAPEEVLNAITRRAEELLSNPQSIVSAPGSTDDRTYIMESKISLKPHFVRWQRTGKRLARIARVGNR